VRHLEAQRLDAGSAHIHAAALARIEQPQRLEPRNRFAHHGAAHAELLCQRGLGRQAIAYRQAPAAHLGRQRIGHLVGKADGGGDRLKTCGHERVWRWAATLTQAPALNS
jgi:hypothetical protein